jgi:hypothetical protein
VPGPQLALRFAALTLFLVAVALGLWLLEVRPALVVVGMVIALGIAWAIEWLAWRAGTEPLVRGSIPTERPAEAPEAEAAQPPSFMPVETETQAVEADAPRPAPAIVGAGPAPPADHAEPEPETPPAPAAPAPVEGRAELRPVPPQPVSEPEPARQDSLPPGVVEFPSRPSQRREWNLWELERLAREEVRRDPARRDEWAYLFLHLRRFASADGNLPSEFDPLVRETFGGLLESSYNR